MSFEHKVALVTGAGFGIGKATAIALAAKGARVYVCDVDMSAARATASLIRQDGHEATAAQLDACSPGAIEAAVHAVAETYGALHFAVNNFASDFAYRRLHEIEERDWNHAIDSMLKSIWLAMKYQIPMISNAGGGAIVNVASSAGVNSSPGLSCLGAAKAAVINLSRSAAAEVADENIRVNAISPGGVLTERLEGLCDSEPGLVQPLSGVHSTGRLAEPEEIASCICFLCSDEASFMSGDNMIVDGGGMMMKM